MSKQKKMIYKITSYIKVENNYNQQTQLYECHESNMYKVYRKGILFGFWHVVGDWLCDSQGNSFCHNQSFDSYEQAKSYIKGWHKQTYGDKYLIEII